MMAIAADGQHDESDDRFLEGEISDELLVDLLDEEDKPAEVDGEEELLCGMCEDQEEVIVPRILKDPKKPTLKDREEHRCLHWPFRSWCRDCLNRSRHA